MTGPQKHTDQTPFTSGGMTGCLGLVSFDEKTSNLFEEEFSLNKNWTTKKCGKLDQKVADISYVDMDME